MTNDDAEAARFITEHIAPATATRHTPPNLCPYCRAYPSVPCAQHRPEATP